jgi:hypothetical protein
VIGPDDERPRPAAAAGFSDAVTIAFGDPHAQLFGVGRVGLAENGASGMLVLFRRGEPVVVAAAGGAPVDGAAAWEEVGAAGVSTAVVDPLRRWRLRYEGDEATLDLDVQATGPLAEIDPAHPVARAGGMTGYEQPATVRGEATVGGERTEVDGLGQRGHSWGAPDWKKISLARSVSAWLGDDLAVSLTAIRPSGKRDHAAEAIAAAVLERDDSGAPRATDVPDPRLSTTYDADGRQRHAGIELWLDDERARRAAGELACGTTLDLGRLRLDCAFFAWRMEGRRGFGRYDVLRRL